MNRIIIPKGKAVRIGNKIMKGPGSIPMSYLPRIENQTFVDGSPIVEPKKEKLEPNEPAKDKPVQDKRAAQSKGDKVPDEGKSGDQAV